MDIANVSLGGWLSMADGANGKNCFPADKREILVIDTDEPTEDDFATIISPYIHMHIHVHKYDASTKTFVKCIGVYEVDSLKDFRKSATVVTKRIDKYHQVYSTTAGASSEYILGKFLSFGTLSELEAYTETIKAGTYVYVDERGEYYKVVQNSSGSDVAYELNQGHAEALPDGYSAQGNYVIADKYKDVIFYCTDSEGEHKGKIYLNGLPYGGEDLKVGDGLTYNANKELTLTPASGGKLGGIIATQEDKKGDNNFNVSVQKTDNPGAAYVHIPDASVDTNGLMTKKQVEMLEGKANKTELLAENISYDNSISVFESTNVQDAIDELATAVYDNGHQIYVRLITGANTPFANKEVKVKYKEIGKDGEPIELTATTDGEGRCTFNVPRTCIYDVIPPAEIDGYFKMNPNEGNTAVTPVGSYTFSYIPWSGEEEVEIKVYVDGVDPSLYPLVNKEVYVHIGSEHSTEYYQIKLDSDGKANIIKKFTPESGSGTVVKNIIVPGGSLYYVSAQPWDESIEDENMQPLSTPSTQKFIASSTYRLVYMTYRNVRTGWVLVVEKYVGGEDTFTSIEYPIQYDSLTSTCIITDYSTGVPVKYRLKKDTETDEGGAPLNRGILLLDIEGKPIKDEEGNDKLFVPESLRTLSLLGLGYRTYELLNTPTQSESAHKAGYNTCCFMLGMGEGESMEKALYTSAESITGEKEKTDYDGFANTDSIIVKSVNASAFRTSFTLFRNGINLPASVPSFAILWLITNNISDIKNINTALGFSFAWTTRIGTGNVYYRGSSSESDSGLYAISGIKGDTTVKVAYTQSLLLTPVFNF